MTLSTKRTAMAGAISLCLIFIAACGKGQSKEAPADTEAATPVQVETARRGPLDRIIVADAVLYPLNQANVTPKISAPVRRVMVNRGDHVKAGQLLAELESRDLASAASETR